MQSPTEKSKTFKIDVDLKSDGARLDKFITDKLEKEFSRKQLQHFIQHYGIFVDGIISNKRNMRLKAHNQLIFTIPENALNSQRNSQLEPVAMDLDIIYEDTDLAVINKPAGLSVHPGAGEVNATLVHGLLHHYGPKFTSANSSSFAAERPGIVHRLDKDTSGLIIVAKHDLAHRLLSQMIERREVSRYYLALVYGKPSELVGVIRSGIRKDPQDHTKMQVSSAPDAKQAVTHFRLIATLPGSLASLLECKLETGRTHQIRVHMEYLKHPIVGDPKYGRGLRGIALTVNEYKNSQKNQENTQNGKNADNNGDCIEYNKYNVNQQHSVKKDSIWRKTVGNTDFPPQNLISSPQHTPSALAKLLLTFPRQALHAWRLEFTHPITGKTITLQVPPPNDMQALINFKNT